jgi:hypothetical protein
MNSLKHLLAGALLAGTGTAHAANLLTNGSFENTAGTCNYP